MAPVYDDVLDFAAEQSLTCTAHELEAAIEDYLEAISFDLSDFGACDIVTPYGRDFGAVDLSVRR